MHYDPIKKSLGKIFNNSVFLRKMFYILLDTLLLRAWHVKKELKKWAKQNNEERNILDAGMGFGQYTFMLSKMCKKWKIKAVDLKTEQVNDCKDFFKKANLMNTEFEIADLTNFKDEDKYNLAISIDVMEHIEDDQIVFNNLYKSLKNNGMLLISTPSDKGGSDVHDHDEEESFIDEHVRDGYSIADIENKLKNAGFEKIASRYQYGKTGKISWQLSMKYPIIMLSKSKLFFILLPFYYIIVMPICLFLNYTDVITKHKEGTGLIVKAYKISLPPDKIFRKE